MGGKRCSCSGLFTCPWCCLSCPPQVPPDALGKIIGPKGKTVQTMIETYGLVNINLEVRYAHEQH